MRWMYCKHYKEGDCVRFKGGGVPIKCGDCEDYELKPTVSECNRNNSKSTRQIALTNGDVIRGMTNEELAKRVCGCSCCVYKDEPDCGGCNCHDGILAFLDRSDARFEFVVPCGNASDSLDKEVEECDRLE